MYMSTAGGEVVSSGLMAVVTVSGRDPGTRRLDEVRTYLVNYTHTSVKEWLIRTTVWCLSNGKTIELRKATDVEEAHMPRFKPPMEKN